VVIGAGHAGDHHLGGLDHCDGIVTPTEFQRLDGIGRDHGGQGLIADAKSHLRQQAVHPYFFHEAVQAIARAQPRDGVVWRRPRRLALRRRRRGMRQQAIDLGVRNAMVPAAGQRGPDASGHDPPLERGITHAELRGGGPHCHQRHCTIPWRW
jgi:hypothetical protein